MKKTTTIFIAILTTSITLVEYFAFNIKEFAIAQSENVEDEFFEVMYNASIIKSSGLFVNIVIGVSLIIGTSTLLLTRKMKPIARIGIIIASIIGIFLCLVIGNNKFYF